MKLHHIGVAVANLDEAIVHYEKMGLRLVYRERIESQQAEVAFMGERPWIELVCGTHPDSAVSTFISQRGPGQHHLAFAVENIAQELSQQEAAGARLIDRCARPGAWGHRVAFLHPRDQGGVLIELVEEAH